MKPHPDFAELDVPTRFVLNGYHLDILTGADVQEDFDAVTGSQKVIQGIFGPVWPDGLTLEDNLIDLHWHYREFTEKRSFAWVIRDRARCYLGCAYLHPKLGGRGVAEGSYWFTDTPDRQAHLTAFGPAYEAWITALMPAGFTIKMSNNAAIG